MLDPGNKTLIPVLEAEEIETVARLADEIWRDHFTPIIGKAQVDYMLDKFQSAPAIAAQLRDGFEYYLAQHEDARVGYIGLVPDSAQRRMMISKFYVRRPARGMGMGGRVLALVIDDCRKRGIHTIWLTVNRHNTATIDWYRRRGFSIVDEARKDIGGGFYMDDYIMELNT